MQRREALALGALFTILAITATWWALALWPMPAAAPDWILRTRAICFGSSADGLPNAGGWILLAAEPLGMIGFLVAAWSDAVAGGIRALARTWGGRWALATASVLLLAGAAGAAARVAGARGEPFDASAATWTARVGRAPPPLRLVDQHGDTVGLSDFAGRPVLVGFAYAHCKTVCPIIVHDMREAAARAHAVHPVMLVITLDPWRDTPDRLAHIAASWELRGDARVLGGSIAAVERTLDAWGVTRARNATDGEITHATGVYVVDHAGHLAYITNGGAAHLAALLDGS